VARRLVRRLVETAAPGATVTRRHVEAVRKLAATDNTGGHLDLPDASVDRRGDLLHIRAGHPLAAQPLAFEMTLPVPGQVHVPASGATIEASRLAGEPDAAIANGAPDLAVLQAASVTLPLAVRNRRPGDRLRPLGAPGRRKVQDVFVDRKVPRSERDRVPIVVDAAGRIVWVAGLVMAEECRVTAPDAGVVILKLRRT
jgi:tRNA(Ile)-lysidine synthase